MKTMKNTGIMLITAICIKVFFIPPDVTEKLFVLLPLSCLFFLVIAISTFQFIFALRQIKIARYKNMPKSELLTSQVNLSIQNYPIAVTITALILMVGFFIMLPQEERFSFKLLVSIYLDIVIFLSMSSLVVFSKNHLLYSRISKNISE
jgi:hypothetical protein